MTFTYHRRLAPLLGVLLVLCVAEALVVHLVASAYWGRKVSVALGIADGVVLLLLVRLFRSLRRRPISLDGEVMTLRTGHRLYLPVALDNIAGFRDDWSSADLKDRRLLNMALIAWPTVVLDLKRPIRRRQRTISAVAHCVDDPQHFREVVERACQQGA